VTPSLFWSQNVDGISMDTMFLEDRDCCAAAFSVTP
jgi:hypothetical protein